MLKNVFAPASGGVAQERLLETIANNLANANTTGYKEEKIQFTGLDSNPWPSYPTPLPPAPFKTRMPEVFPLHGNEMAYVAIGEVRTDFQQGGLQKTGNPLDLALQGDGFFVVNTPFGERWTRDGGFGLTADGTLITKNGHPVLGQKGVVSGLKEGELQILPGGEIWAGGRYVDTLRRDAFEDTRLLQKMGDNLFVHDGPPSNRKDPKGEVTQGYLEGSNANPMRNLTSMIVAHRTYESLQKAVKSQDETMQQGNRIGETGG